MYKSLLLLNDYVSKIKNLKLNHICNTVLGNNLFQEAPAAVKNHHCYDGGLVVHVEEVVKYALAAAKSFPKVNKDVLVTSAILHDYAKIWDYKKIDGTWTKVDYAGKIHHVAGSHSYFVSQAVDVDEETSRAIQHCILSHHGRPEWGSVIVPQTLEAQLLHNADSLSAWYGEGR